jgi:predicted NUDIX family NTP pyrophosphohydrolase
MGKQSAGIMPFRLMNGELEIFLVHPGGPFFAKKDLGAWSISKGEFDVEDALTAAKREFLEETGVTAEGEFIQLTPVIQKGGKKVFAWAVEQYIDAETVKSNTFLLEFPLRSGRMVEYPEIDKAGWFPVAEALKKINSAQSRLITQLILKLKQLK